MFMGFAVLSALAGVGAVVDQIQEGRTDPVLVIFAAGWGALAAWGTGMASMRIATDDSGVDLRNAAFRHEQVAWTDIERFEIAERGHAAMLVRRDGSRIPLIGYAVSPLERRRGHGSPAVALVEALNGELAARRGRQRPT